jgi:hypothetical protein
MDLPVWPTEASQQAGLVKAILHGPLLLAIAVLSVIEIAMNRAMNRGEGAQKCK